MRCVIQRVLEACVTVDKKPVGAIQEGLVLLFGANDHDDLEKVQWLAKKIVALRVFENDQGKIDTSLKQGKRAVLVVSQFTLYGDCIKGNRPSFTQAGDYDHANYLYQALIKELEKEGVKVQSGQFGASMQLSLVNDGPFTLILEK